MFSFDDKIPHPHNTLNGCFPPEKKSFTAIEEMNRTSVMMKETIDRLLSFEQRTKREFDDLMRTMTTDNVTFKDTMRSSWELFLNNVKNEINMFESNVDNTVALFQKDIESNYANLNENVIKNIEQNVADFNAKVDEFETTYNEAFATLKTNLQEQYNSFADNVNTRIDNNNTTFEQSFADYQQKMTTEINMFEASINQSYLNFVTTVNESIRLFKETWTQGVEENLRNQNAKIDDLELYMKTNLVGTVTALIGDMQDNGEFAEIIEGEVFNNFENKLNNTRTYANIQNYGAIGDWKSHPLSESYLTLDEALIDYPNATALTDEKDTLALMLAIESENDVVLIPYGGYQIDREIMLNDYTIIEGISQDKTQLRYNSLDGNCFNVEGKNKVQIKNLYITNSANTFVQDTVSCIDGNNAIGINAKNCCYSSFENIRIYGFNKGIDFAENSYVSTVRDCKIQNCDCGINGNSEFNSITIDNCEIHHCNIGVIAGAGRTKNLNNCTFEHNNTGVSIVNKGTAEITNCYFEGNYNKDIKIGWGMSSVDLVTIERCSFYNFRSDRFIEYHMKNDRLLIVSNCYFEKSEGNVNEECYVVVPTDNTLLIPIMKNNMIVNCDEVKTPTNIIKDVTKREGFCYLGAIDNVVLVEDNIIKGYSNFRFTHNDGIKFEIPFIEAKTNTRIIHIVANSNNTEATYNLKTAENVSVINYVGSLKVNKVYTLILNRIYNGDDGTLLNEWIVAE